MNIDTLTPSEKRNALQAIETLLLSPGWDTVLKELRDLVAAKRDQALAALRVGDDTNAKSLTGISDGLWMAMQTPGILLEILRADK